MQDEFHQQSSPVQAAQQLVRDVLAPLWRSIAKSSIQTSGLFLATSIGVAAVVASPAMGSPAPAQQKQNSQLVSQAPPTVQLTLVSYAVTQAAYDRIIPLFVEQWRRTHNGQNVEFNTSYGGSGSQARAVIDGLEADVVALALSSDVSKIEQAGLIDDGWESEAPNDAIVTHSVIAFVTRQGNPKRIRTWSDLVRPDVAVITANPKTSGGARWNFLGLWGSITETGGTETQARDFVSQVYRNTPVLPRDAREATDTFFTRGQGDVLLNYENEVILASQRGEDQFFSVIPPVNISIDAPVAVVDKNVDEHGTREVAEAFVEFLFTPAAQREFASVGFRPVNPEVAREVQNRFPRVSQLYTVQDFGGWSEVQRRFFDDGGIFDQIYTTQSR
ncbi:MAG TPA: sulfate ABC transporter substrate-binding protein [Chroococcidiopsis sp.]